MKLVTSFDQFFIRAIQGISIPWFGKLMAAATFIGEGLFLYIAAIAIGTIYLSLRLYNFAWAFLATFVLMYGYNVSKLIFNRARPDNPYAGALKDTSFPSGHAADSVAFYGLVGYLMFKRLPEPYNYLGIIVGVIFPFLIGISRVYLGAHYPSDVLGGWLIALIGLVIVIKIFHL